MKILFLSGNLCDGGAQRVISVVSGYLAEKGYDVSLLLFSRNEKEYPISDKVKIISISESYEEYCNVSLIERLKFIRKYLKEQTPDVAVGFLEGGYALYLASFGMRFAKITSARFDPARIFKMKGLRAKINKMWFNSADAIVLQTNSQLEHVSERMAKRSVVIANPVSDYALSQRKEDYSICEKFVMAGRLARQKNYPMVFEAVKRVKQKHPNVHVDIFGKGGEEEYLMAMLKEMGIEENVSLLGWTQDTIGEYMKRDAYILSSDFEGMPNALMEAMAIGLPCISTNCDTGPSDLIVDGENGYLIPVGDSNVLAEKMTAFIEMTPQMRKQIGDAARITLADNYNSLIICEKWESLFKTIVEQRKI